MSGRSRAKQAVKPRKKALKRQLLQPPVATFTSEAGRGFTVAEGEHDPGRWEGDTIWCDTWPILHEGQPAGKLFRSSSYGKTVEGLWRWHASTRELFWAKASGAPTGVGFDVAAFDTAEQCVAAWARSADQILDWSEGKFVWNGYGLRVRKTS